VIAEFLRDSSKDSFPDDWDEYKIKLALVCSEVVSYSNGMSASFYYESAKDVLRWHKMSVKKYIKTVMNIGSMIYLDDKTFSSLLTRSSVARAYNGDDIDRMARAMNHG
jgi:hypothetical protein